MKQEDIQKLETLWEKYFPGQEQPIACFYADNLHGADPVRKPGDNVRGYTCMFAQIAKVHKGSAVALSQDSLGCWGAISTLFGGLYNEEATVRLLTEIERFKQTPELANALHTTNPPAIPTGKYFIMKPLSTLTDDDDPEIFCVFAKPDVIAALHTLVGFDDARPDSVIVPFGSGCEQCFKFALHEARKDHPRAVIGGMDVAMRGCLKADTQVFSAPAGMFCHMMDNMDDSFMGTYIWEGLRKRLRPKENS